MILPLVPEGWACHHTIEVAGLPWLDAVVPGPWPPVACSASTQATCWVQIMMVERVKRKHNVKIDRSARYIDRPMERWTHMHIYIYM